MPFLTSPAVSTVEALTALTVLSVGEMLSVSFRRGFMVQPQREQRATRRFSLRLPVSVKFDTSEKSAQTRDVSARGICFYMDDSVAEGSEIEFTLTLPPEITLTESIRVHCKGKVVRVEPESPGGRVGIAAIIERYEFLSESS